MNSRDEDEIYIYIYIPYKFFVLVKLVEIEGKRHASSTYRDIGIERGSRERGREREDGRREGGRGELRVTGGRSENDTLVSI